MVVLLGQHELHREELFHNQLYFHVCYRKKGWLRTCAHTHHNGTAIRHAHTMLDIWNVTWGQQTNQQPCLSRSFKTTANRPTKQTTTNRQQHQRDPWNIQQQTDNNNNMHQREAWQITWKRMFLGFVPWPRVLQRMAQITNRKRLSYQPANTW